MDEIEREARAMLSIALEAEAAKGYVGRCGDELPHVPQVIAEEVIAAALRSARAPDGWVSVLDRRPERNTMAVYWHRSACGGYQEIADEWRDEQFLDVASHWHPGASTAPRGSDA